MRDPGERPDFLATNGQVTVAGQRQTCTGFVVTARAIRGSGRLNRDGYSVARSVDQVSRFVKFQPSCDKSLFVYNCYCKYSQ